jgi:hypothetical protein
MGDILIFAKINYNACFAAAEVDFRDLLRELNVFLLWANNGKMKRLLLSILLTFLLYQAQAQYKPVIFGLKVGGNLGWMKSDAEGYSGDGVVPGFTWGFIGDFFVMENYAISTGFNVNFNGGKLEYPHAMDLGSDTVPVGGMLHRRYSLKYLQIPLALKMKAEIGEKLRLFGKVGIGTAFNLSSRAEDDFIYEGGESSSEKKNINDEITLMRQSLLIGGGVELVLKGSTSLVFEVTYDNGFNNILKGNNTAYPDRENRGVHNFVELGAGILF